MRKLITWGLALMLVAAVIVPISLAEEDKDPALADIPKQPGPRKIWELNFHTGIKIGEGDPFDADDLREWKFTRPRAIVIKKETDEPEVYWYLLYTIQNHDKDDHPFFLNVSACSDKANASDYGVAHNLGHKIGGKDSAIYNDLARDDVKKAVQRKLINELSRGEGMKDRGTDLADWTTLCLPKELAKKTELQPKEVEGEGIKETDEGVNLPVIKAGETKRCIAIFKKLDNEARTIKIYFQGLTNDFKIVTHLQDTTLSEFERIGEERVYEVVYQRNGDEFFTTDDWIDFEKKGWVTWKRKYKVDLKHEPSYPNSGDGDDD